MFGLGIVDHVRLNLTRTGENYTVHARAAERLAGLTSRIRIGVLVLILVSVAASVVSLMELGRWYRVAAVVAASLAFAGHAAYIAWGFEGRVYSHRVFAHNLWLVCERHRALLAEIQDGLLDREAILRRRDALAAETHNAYGQTFPLDQPAYESVRQSTEGEGQGQDGDAHLDSPVGSSSPSHPAGRETSGSLSH
jgi:hypothetical protein